jgi:hypothetical protein
MNKQTEQENSIVRQLEKIWTHKHNAKTIVCTKDFYLVILVSNLGGITGYPD